MPSTLPEQQSYGDDVVFPSFKISLIMTFRQLCLSVIGEHPPSQRRDLE